MPRNADQPLVELRFESTLCSMDADALIRLARQVWRSNVAAGVTGEMLVDGARIRQVVEGPQDVLLPIAARILADRRHTEIALSAFGLLEARRYSGWHVDGLPAGTIASGACREAVVALRAAGLGATDEAASARRGARVCRLGGRGSPS